MSLVNVLCKAHKNEDDIYFNYSFSIPSNPILGNGIGKIKFTENFYELIHKEIEKEISYQHHVISDFSCEIQQNLIKEKDNELEK